jgi:hypothetical protein
MLFALVYALPIFFKNVKDDFFEYIMVLVIYIFVIQGVISLISFVYEPVGDFLISLHNEGTVDRLSHVAFRFYCLSGNSFFDLPAGFGLSIMLFIRLQFIEGKDYFPGIRKYLIFVILLIGCSFIGRTSFVGVALSLAMGIFMVQDVAVKLRRIIVGLLGSSIILLIMFFLLKPAQQQMVQNNVLPFAFEFFYRYQEGDGLRTASSDSLEDMYFPVSQETLWKGDGYFFAPGGYAVGGYYKGTDAGYMRQVLFGGIPYILLLILYQLLFFLKPMRLASYQMKITNRNDLLLWLTFLGYIFVLNYKGDALGRMQLYQVLILLLGTAYIKQYDRE